MVSGVIVSVLTPQHVLQRHLSAANFAQESYFISYLHFQVQLRYQQRTIAIAQEAEIVS